MLLARKLTVRSIALAGAIAGFSATSVWAQAYHGLGYVPGGFRRSMVQQATYPCPYDEGVRSPAPLARPPVESGDGDSGADIPDPQNDAGVPADDYLPDVADLSSDAGFASASQSAAPNMIGDTFGFGGTGYITYGDLLGTSTIPFSPGGGRKFKASTNQSPLPQDRFFYNFHLFDNALDVRGPGDGVDSLDVTRHEFGWERTFWGGLASLQLQVPFSNSIDSSLTGYDLSDPNSDIIPNATDTELGNIAFALKAILYQTECETYALGLAVDLPTSQDVLIDDVDGDLGTLSIETNAVTLSPFAGWLYQSSCRWYAQGFVQFAVPLSENDYRLTSTDDSLTGEIEEDALFYADIGVGYWFYNSDFDGAGCGGKGCCNSYGVAGIVELHYTTSLDGDNSFSFDETANNTFQYQSCDWLNLSLGMAAYRNCWSLRPAVVLPLREAPDRQFDVEWTVQINRRY
jgi:hypothetical protein